MPLVPLAGLGAGVVLAALLPALAAVAVPTEIGTSTFNTNAASTWGTAEKGGAWTTKVPRGAKATAVSGQARIQSLAKANAAEALLGSVTALDVDMSAVIGVPTGSRTYTALVVRRQADGSAYRARLEVSPTGGAAINVTKVVKGKETGLGAIALPFANKSGVPVHVELRALGTSSVTVAARAWTGADSAAPGWQISKTDSSSTRIQRSGIVGFWQYASGSNASPVTTTFDNVHVVDEPDSTPAPVTTPTPAPTPVSPAPSGGAVGSAPVGSTAYAVPASAILVSPTGQDGAAGTIAAPLRTIAAAVSKAVSGQTIVLRAGTYNESVTIPVSKRLTIQSYPHEAVWLDGSVPVTSWAKTGSRWTTSNWNFFPSSSIMGVADNPRFVDPAYPMAARPDQVFVNGSALKQVASASSVTAGTFAVDANAKTVTIGSDPAPGVRISNLGQAIYAKSSGDTLRGFGVRRYATDSSQYAAVKFENTDATAENLVVDDNAYIGLSTGNNNSSLEHLTVERNGQLGIGSAYSYGLEVSHSIVEDNNSEFFKNAPVSGGIKITRTRGVTITDNVVTGNNSAGIWCDESCYDITITGNTVSQNRTTGIQLELSQKAVIADNTVTSQPNGMNIIDTGDVQIYNNDIGDTTRFGIQTLQDSRTASDLSVPGHDPRQPLPDPTMPWKLKNITIANNAFGASSGYQVYAWDGSATGFTIAGNLFNLRGTPSQATLVAWVAHGSSSLTRYDSPQAIRSLNANYTNGETLAVAPLSAMKSDILRSLTLAVPLPSGVASVVGEPVGTKGVGTF